ncbi:MAG: transaldolase family protein [Pirellulaceae bacterium]|nr:transaldolase family protein [Pirellulaceae bacterium]
MSESIQSLVASGTKLWLDSIDPDLVVQNKAMGATGATSNPIIIANLIKTGRFDSELQKIASKIDGDVNVTWALTDHLVRDAQAAFHDVWQTSQGNNGYVSFELDPLLEDPTRGPSHEERVASYIQTALHWNEGNDNRMIKVPATPAGLDALEEMVAAGVNVNVTLVFTDRQYQLAREAVWRGAQRRQDLSNFKSVYSIFVSRIDVYTEKHVPQLSAEAQGLVGIVNAQRIWQDNQNWWADKNCPLQQEIIFASTGTKKASDPAWKYVAALAGSDIQTNPPATNDAVAESGTSFERKLDQLPAAEILAEIDEHVDFAHLEETLMREGIDKFAAPQIALLELVGEKRAAMAT